MPKSILLIEPDNTLATTYKAAIEHAGYTVICKRTAATSVMALDEEPIDLVVLELNMALHNGLEFLYEIRSYVDLQHIKVILHTNVRKAQIDSPVLSQLKISQYLYKPTTSLQQLQDTIGAVLQIKV